MVVCIFAIPYPMRRITFENLTPTILGIYPVATALIGKILKDQVDSAGRRRAESALRESEERLKLALKGSRQGFWDWNLETGEVKRDDGWAGMLGYTLAEVTLMEDPWKTLLHPDDSATAIDTIQQHVNGDTPHYRIEYRMQHKNGTFRWILDQAQVVKFNLDGKPVRMSGTHTDITELKETEKKLRDKADELEKFNRLMLGRELRMIELKKEVNTLLKKAGEDEKYTIPG
jgi:PAS domain S-box-containing protein